MEIIDPEFKNKHTEECYKPGNLWKHVLHLQWILRRIADKSAKKFVWAESGAVS